MGTLDLNRSVTQESGSLVLLARGASALRDVSESSWGRGWAALDNYMVFQEPCQVLNSHFLMNPLQS